MAIVSPALDVKGVEDGHVLAFQRLVQKLEGCDVIDPLNPGTMRTCVHVPALAAPTWSLMGSDSKSIVVIHPARIRGVCRYSSFDAPMNPSASWLPSAIEYPTAPEVEPACPRLNPRYMIHFPANVGVVL